MGWSIGYDTNWKRDIGYGVPAVCDHPKCSAKINRGLAYVCGGFPYGGSIGCGLYFCPKHLYLGRSNDASQLCPKCYRYDHKPYRAKPDTKQWIKWKMTDSSWAKWRKENNINESNSKQQGEDNERTGEVATRISSITFYQ